MGSLAFASSVSTTIRPAFVERGASFRVIGTGDLGTLEIKSPPKSGCQIRLFEAGRDNQSTMTMLSHLLAYDSSTMSRQFAALDAASLIPVAFRFFEDTDMAASASQSQSKDLFLYVTLPMVAVVIAAAWVLYSKLDDSIESVRLEAKQDLGVYSRDVNQRFDRIDTKLDSISGKMTEVSSMVTTEVSELRVRQAQIESRR
ncbi:Uncharacterised protein [Stutzerimonas stutzeri]|uniref:hypothetical protein n=1 Tax=Stutzerimonas stutzeri subgroup TaxID=578833 RepID=UPI000C6C9831|nr:MULTISPECIES: hypothetical protein [Stutzerimonas stutzeri subgroup]MCQ2048797.1 hypothetical protein [Stutzerimonas kunmingensis]PKR26521.1 hypothetical protein CXK90_12825 [Stutzerimonas stutzeri]QQC13208.1 hypothetical protein I6I22_10540 [Stutzerimonas stutzeri]VEI35384.1 Uncharacterised protein [Stutzerimonas stutzeri]